MTARSDPDVVIAAWLQDDAVEGAPERLLTATRDRIRSTSQRRAWWSARRTRSTFRTALGAMAVVAVLVSGAILITRPSQPAIVGPSPTPEASASPSQPAVASPSATLTPTPTAEVSPPAVGQSRELTWSKVSLEQRSPRVAWLGDRFVLVDGDSGAVFTSTDGFSWHALQPGDHDPGYAELLTPRRDHPNGAFVSWQDQVVGWWNPEDGPNIGGKPPITARDILRIVRPPEAPTETTPFKGRIESIGIGPAGIVAHVHSHLDWDEWVASKLGRNWVSHYTGVDYKNGILRIGMDDGPGLRVNWADEGFLPGDYQDLGFGWFSPDGEQWTAIPGFGEPGADGGQAFPTGLGDVVGVSDGFIVRGVNPEDTCPLPAGCGDMWHSADGLTWRNLGGPAVDSFESVVLPWMGGALVTDGVGRFEFWTSEGRSELPMATEVRAAWKSQSPDSQRAFSAGPLGLVSVSMNDKQILVTRDGIDVSLQPMPAEMAADADTHAIGREPLKSVVVGDGAVLVMVSGGDGESPTYSLWLGTFEP